jgi:hypothetical protein
MDAAAGSREAGQRQQRLGSEDQVEQAEPGQRVMAGDVDLLGRFELLWKPAF